MAEIQGFGRLGTDPELKMVGESKDKPVAAFRLYLSSLRKKDGETVDEGDWCNVNIWGSFAEPAAKFFSKGDPVYLAAGTLRTERWQGEDGEDRTTLVIDTNRIFPHLPALEQIAFKPRKSVAKGETEEEALDEAEQDATA